MPDREAGAVSLLVRSSRSTKASVISAAKIDCDQLPRGSLPFLRRTGTSDHYPRGIPTSALMNVKRTPGAHGSVTGVNTDLRQGIPMVSFERHDLEMLRHSLARRATELRGQIAEMTGRAEDEPFRAIAGEVGDSGDESTASSLIDTERAEIGRDIGELRAIEAALTRIDSGKYGQCSDCEAPIDSKRLRAQPTALRCITCQERYEKAHGAAGGASL